MNKTKKTRNCTRETIAANLIKEEYFNEKGETTYVSYIVRYVNKYFSTTRRFRSLKEAEKYKEMCDDKLNQARFNNGSRQIELVRELGEWKTYPENLLHDLDITAENCSNYDSYVVSHFAENFEIVAKGLRPRLIKILNKRYQNYETLNQIGKEEHITRERVRQLLNAATTILKRQKNINTILMGRKAVDLMDAEEKMRRLSEIKESLTYEAALEIVERYQKTSQNALLRARIEELDLSTRATNCLHRYGVFLIGDLCKLTESDVLKLRNAGRGTCREIIMRLEDVGLSLKGE